MPLTIKSISDITDENLKQCSATVITDFISSEFRNNDEKWKAEQAKLDNQLAEASKNYEKLSQEHAQVQESLKAIQATVEALNAEKVAREEVERFNARMGSVTEAFELDDEARAAVVDEIKALASDEAFEKWMTKANVLLKAFSKKNKNLKNGEKSGEHCDPDKGPAEDPNFTKDKSKASESNASVVEDAINNAEPEKANIPNTSTPTQSMKEKYQNAFAMNAFDIKFKR